METTDLNSIGLAYLQMVEKRNTEAKANHAAVLAAALDEKMDPTDHVKQNDDGMWCVYSKDNKKLKEFKKESDANEWAVDNHDTLMSEAKKKLHPNQKALDADGDGDIEADDLADLRKDADKDDKKFDKKKKKSSKDDEEDDGDENNGSGEDDQEKIKETDTCDKCGKAHDGACIGETNENASEGKIRIVNLANVHPDNRMGAKETSGHQVQRMTKGKFVNQGKPYAKQAQAEKERNSGQSSMQFEAANRRNIKSWQPPHQSAHQAALAKGLTDYSKEIGKDHMDHGDFADHAKHVKAGDWDKARTHANDQDTEVREKIHSLAIDHLGLGDASELYGEHGDMSEATIPDGQTAMTKKPDLTKKDKKTMGKIADLMKTANESVNVDDVLAFIDQGYTLDQAEAMVAEASCGTVNASRQGKAGELERNVANDQRSIPVKSVNTSPVRPGTKQQQRDFDKAAKTAKSKDKVSVSKAPWDEQVENYKSHAQRKAVWASRNDAKNEELHGDQHKLDHNGDNKIDASDMKKVRTHGAVKKKAVSQMTPKEKTANAERRKEYNAFQKANRQESVMDRVSNMVEGIRVDIQEKNEINELDKKTLGRYVKKASGDMAISALKTRSDPAKAMRKVGKRGQGISRAVDKMTKEDTTKINELDKKTLGSYAKKAVVDVDKQKADADKFEFRGMAAKNPGVMDKNFKKANRAGDKIDNRKAGINRAIDKMTVESVKEGVPTTRKELQKYRFAKEYEKRGMKYPYSTADTSKADEKEARAMIAQISNREKKESVQEAVVSSGKVIHDLPYKDWDAHKAQMKKTHGVKTTFHYDKLKYHGSKPQVKKALEHLYGKGYEDHVEIEHPELYEEATKPTGVHHSTPVTAAQANDEQARGRWTDKAGRNTMTEKEFVDMHTIHPDVLPEFDGNVAAKKTAEAIKKNPKVSPTPNPNPNAGDKNKVKSTEAPAANAGVVGESYMDKYAKYIRGDK